MSGGKSHSKRQITLANCDCSLRPQCMARKAELEKAGEAFRDCPASG